MLGIEPDARYSDVTVPLEPGDTIALYTDGLIERPTQSLDVGIAALSSALARRPGGDLDEFCSVLADELGSERDDVALLVATVESAPAIAASYCTSVPADPRQIAILRHELEDWFEQQRLPSDDRWALTLATGELATNAIEHGCAQDGVSLVTVEARRRADSDRDLGPRSRHLGKLDPEPGAGPRTRDGQHRDGPGEHREWSSRDDRTDQARAQRQRARARRSIALPG